MFHAAQFAKLIAPYACCIARNREYILMKPGSRVLRLTGIVLCCWLLSACEPSVGKAIERVTIASPDGSTTITAIRYAEGTWGNPADGEHLRMFCNSAELLTSDRKGVDGRVLGQAYFVSKLGAIPKDRIMVYSNKIIYGTLFSNFFITQDGCRTVKTWAGNEELNRKRKKYSDDYGHAAMTNISLLKAEKISLFKAANLCPNGNIVLTIDESYLIEEQETWAISTDGAKSWTLKAIRPKC